MEIGDMIMESGDKHTPSELLSHSLCRKEATVATAVSFPPGL